MIIHSQIFPSKRTLAWNHLISIAAVECFVKCNLKRLIFRNSQADLVITRGSVCIWDTSWAINQPFIHYKCGLISHSINLSIWHRPSSRRQSFTYTAETAAARRQLGQQGLSPNPSKVEYKYSLGWSISILKSQYGLTRSRLDDLS